MLPELQHWGESMRYICKVLSIVLGKELILGSYYGGKIVGSRHKWEPRGYERVRLGVGDEGIAAIFPPKGYGRL